MKKIIYALMVPLTVAIILLFTNCETKNETAKKPTQKNLTLAEKKAQKKKWKDAEMMFEKWKVSSEGKKILAAEDKVKQSIRDSTNMEAVVTSLSLPPDSKLGFGVMVRINNDDYILSFWTLKPDEFQHLRSLKVNDTITLKSHAVSHAPKYAYPILSGSYVERATKIIYKRIPRKDGC